VLYQSALNGDRTSQRTRLAKHGVIVAQKYTFNRGTGSKNRELTPGYVKYTYTGATGSLGRSPKTNRTATEKLLSSVCDRSITAATTHCFKEARSRTPRRARPIAIDRTTLPAPEPNPHDHVIALGRRAVPSNLCKSPHNDDDRNHKASRNETIFDGGCLGFIFAKRHVDAPRYFVFVLTPD
jgi:hypothetical protein